MAAVTAARAGYPLHYDVEYPERLSRWLIFVKWLLIIPHVGVLYLLQILTTLVTILAWFGILFTGRYPSALFDVAVGAARWSANIWCYAGLLRDDYPPLSWDPGRYPLTYEVEYPERLSRLLIFFKWLLIIPHVVVIYVLALVAAFVYVVVWFAILFTGKMPRGMFNFLVGFSRWYLRVGAYILLLRDEYPPFSLR